MYFANLNSERMKRAFIAVLFFCFSAVALGQYFSTGQDPASLKWRQINTGNFQLIYPDYYEEQAQKLAGMMEKVYLSVGKSLHHNPQKISLVLHTQTVNSNGLVAWAPKRMEFYTIPHQGIYSQNWLEQLAIHEFRHVVQIDKISSELPKIIKLLLGEQGAALVFGMYLPWWFIEGDAVVAETAFSNSGRGRFPSFLMEHRALAVEKGNYKYDKAYNSSYKNYVPDHYKLGYYMVGETRKKYGNQLWNNVLNRVGEKPFSVTPFNKVLKNETGLNKVKLYQSVFADLKQTWVSEDQEFKNQVATVISPEKKGYASYQFNHWLNDSTILSYKTSLNKTPEFVLVSNQKEKVVLKPGPIFNESINYKGEWMTWSEEISDPRWHHSGKSIIRMYNVLTKTKHSLKTEFTAFSPAISPGKDRIAVVESDFRDNFYLTIYNVKTGEPESRFQSTGNNYFFSPAWLNENEIIAIALIDNFKKIVKINPYKKEMIVLLEKDFGEIKSIKVVNERVWFIGSFTGKNCLYCLNLNNKTVEKMPEPRFGFDYPAISENGKKQLVSDYTAEGFRLIELDPAKQEIVQDEAVQKVELADFLQNQEPGVLDFSNRNDTLYVSSKYSKPGHLLNFHSWAPAAVQTDVYEFAPGISFVSQNKLGTATLDLGYKWKTEEKTGDFYGKYTFKGWYPVFDLEATAGKNASKYASVTPVKNTAGQVVGQDTTFTRFTWNQTQVSADLRVPLDFSRKNFSRFLQPEVKLDYTSYSHDETTPDNFFEGQFRSAIYRLYFQQLQRQSYQDVYPNLGIIADFNFKHTPFGKTDLGTLFLGQTSVFLPGLMHNHGIKLFAAYQKKEHPSHYSFAESIRYPRGWGKINTTDAQSFSADYKLPLFYPEWSVGGLVYLKRVNTSLFADYAMLKGNIYEKGKVTGTYSTNISSYGIELTGDMHFLRFYAPVEMGFRTSYLPEAKNVYVDFLFSIDFNSL